MQAGDNSKMGNGSSENYYQSLANDSSWIGGNLTSTIDEFLQKDSHPYQTNSIESVSIVCVALCFGVWAAVANSLPLAAIIKHRHLHTPAYILTANLAASDVLNGMAFVILCSLNLFFAETETDLSIDEVRVRSTSVTISALSSAYSLLALTAERYWFVVHGMTYVNNVTNDKCKVLVLIVWVWSVLLAMLPNFGWHCDLPIQQGCLPLGRGLPYSYVVFFLVSVFLPLAAIVFFNMGIFWCLWKHMNAIAAQEAAVGAQPSINRKSAITIVIITVVFLVGWLPLLIKMTMLSPVRGSLVKMMVFMILNSAINPVIYAFRLREVHRGVARLFRNGNAILPGTGTPSSLNRERHHAWTRNAILPGT